MIVESDRTGTVSAVQLYSGRSRGPKRIAWRRSAPGELIDAAASCDLAPLGRALRSRRPFRTRAGGDAERICPAVLQPLWSRHAFGENPTSRALVELLLQCDPRALLTRKQRRRTEEAVAGAFEARQGEPAPDPFELLGWLTLLVAGPRLADDLFASLWLQGCEWSRPYWSAAGWQREDGLSDDQRVLKTGELPWLCSHVFGDIKGARRVRERGLETLRAELLAGCDNDGTPHAYLLERLPLWLASLTRTAHLAAVFDAEWWNRPARVRYARLVRRVAAMTRSSGEVALSNGAAFAQPSLLKTAAACARLKRRERPVQFLAQLPPDSMTAGARGGRSESRSVRPPRRGKHRPSAESDAARIACLRSNWDPGADACVIAFDGATPRIDLTAFGVPLLHGGWDLQVTVRGGAAQVRSDWECVCWFSDADTDYLELKQTASPDVEVLRQVLLSRNDHFVLLADVVKSMAGSVGPIELSTRLPLVPGAHAEQDALTREWRVKAGPLKVRVLPLGLPQESLHRADGSLAIDSAAIVLRQRAAGSGVACPLVLDWSPARRKAATQWRPLTIAEGGVTLGGADACGVRWRIGDAQWVYYHALTPRVTARTVLGMHTFNETVIGEFAGGELQQLVQVEEGGPA